MASVPIIGVTRAPRVTPRPSRPLPEGVIDHGHRYTLVQRVHCLALITEGLWPAEIEKKTDVKPRTQRAIKQKEQDRGITQMKNPGFLNHMWLIMCDRDGHVLSPRIKRKRSFRWFELIAQVERNQVRF
jgi:hypothetical protein